MEGTRGRCPAPPRRFPPRPDSRLLVLLLPLALLLRVNVRQQLLEVVPLAQLPQRLRLPQPLAVALLLEQPALVALAQQLHRAPPVEVGDVLALVLAEAPVR